MLKKIGILGLAGIIAAGIGVTGCSGSASATSDAGIDSEAATAEDFRNGSSETESVVEETTIYETTASAADDDFPIDYSIDENNTRKVGDKYVYLICDGEVEVELNTNVFDYLKYGSEYEPTEDDPYANRYKYLDLYHLADDLGWEPSLAEQKSMRKPEDAAWYMQKENPTAILKVDYDIPRDYDRKGAAGTSIVRRFGFTDVNDKLYEGGKVCYLTQVEPEKAIYRVNRGDRSATFDQVVLITFGLEHPQESWESIGPMYRSLVGDRFVA